MNEGKFERALRLVVDLIEATAPDGLEELSFREIQHLVADVYSVAGRALAGEDVAPVLDEEEVGSQLSVASSQLGEGA